MFPQKLSTYKYSFIVQSYTHACYFIPIFIRWNSKRGIKQRNCTDPYQTEFILTWSERKVAERAAIIILAQMNKNSPNFHVAVSFTHDHSTYKKRMQSSSSFFIGVEFVCKCEIVRLNDWMRKSMIKFILPEQLNRAAWNIEKYSNFMLLIAYASYAILIRLSRACTACFWNNFCLTTDNRLECLESTGCVAVH